MALETGFCLLDLCKRLYPSEGPSAFPVQVQGNTRDLHSTPQESAHPEKLSSKNRQPLLQKSCGE